MPHKRKKKKKSVKRPRKNKPNTYYDLEAPNNTLSTWKQNSTTLNKVIGPPRFSDKEQKENPHKQQTRVVKDVLRVGKWKGGLNKDGTAKFWDVTPQTLQKIKSNFDTHRVRGIAHNLCWGHGDPTTGIVDERDSIAGVDDVFIHGDRLWTSHYVNPEQARDLQLRNRQVSVRAAPNYVDGQGRKYDGECLLHVAVVDHGVVDSQGPFFALSMGSTSKMKKASIVPRSLRKRKPTVLNDKVLRAQQLYNLQKSVGEELEEDEDVEVDDLIDEADEESESEDIDSLLADDDLAEAIEASPEGTTVVPLAEHVEQINRILPQGLDIPVEGPNAVTEQTFNRDFGMLVTIAENAGLVPTEEEKAGEDGGGPDEGLGEGGDELSGELLSPETLSPEELPAELANHPVIQAVMQLQQPLVDAIQNLQMQVSAQETATKYDLKDQFRTELRELINNGRITKGAAQTVLENGKKYGYDLSLLTPFQDASQKPVIDLENRSRQLASGSPQRIPGVSDGDQSADTMNRLVRAINPNAVIPKNNSAN